ncbi:MAG: ATP-binding protein, partial [bacterium]|nr:ATP-binding protein [bacterium]
NMTTKEQKKRKTFNTSGLCFPGKHYMVEPLTRLDEVEDLVREELYFTIHAPRQTGKTTYLHALSRKLNRDAKHIAMVVSFEQAGYGTITVEKANELLIYNIFTNACQQLPEKFRPKDPRESGFLNLKDYLATWSEAQKIPIVLLVDEIDALMDEVLISILRQFRDGYQGRPDHFPASIVLVGLRDVRDYKAAIRDGQASLGTASPFNIKSDSLFLSNFTKEEVFGLLEQYGKETGQVFPVEVKEEICRLGAGQPWLTNALARQITAKILKYDFSRAITLSMVNDARRQLILRRDTHLDSLVDKLRENRVKRIVQAIIQGDNLSHDIMDDDIAYVSDLGIVGRTSPLKFANPIYAEIIPRIMASPMEYSIPENIRTPRFMTPAGILDMEKVLKEFQVFYRRNSESWTTRFQYRESAQQLLLMAFLQRVVNAGGDIIREMAVGNGRIDMLVKYKEQQFALELKINRFSYTIPDGKEQLHGYLDRLGLDEGYLVIFDPGDKSWDEKITYDKITYKGKTLFMVGM